MALPIEDYADRDCRTAALVGRDGSIDWFVRRFDAAACFAALLGTPEHRRWLIAPCAPVRRAAPLRRGMLLETVFETDEVVRQ
jgi:hypothetical protein